MSNDSGVTSLPAKANWRSLRGRRDRQRKVTGWLFVAPALLMYGAFVLQPLFLTIQYSFYEWNGVSPATWVGLSNYQRVITDPDLLGPIINSFRLLFFFCVIPVSLGVVTASVIHRASAGRFGSIARSVIFLPQIIPLIAAGIIWGWLLALPGLINRLLSVVGLEGVTRAWLGDFGTALPAVGLIGIWVLLGFCTVLLQTGMSKINPELYEAARLDGAGWWAELRSVTIPGIRNEIGVCITVTAIASLAAFDIVYVSTGGGPGRSTTVPGIKIYIEAFLQRRVGLASALAVALVVLVLLVIIPVQRLTRGDSK